MRIISNQKLIDQLPITNNIRDRIDESRYPFIDPKAILKIAGELYPIETANDFEQQYSILLPLSLLYPELTPDMCVDLATNSIDIRTQITAKVDYDKLDEMPTAFFPEAWKLSIAKVLAPSIVLSKGEPTIISAYDYGCFYGYFSGAVDHQLDDALNNAAVQRMLSNPVKSITQDLKLRILKLLTGGLNNPDVNAIFCAALAYPEYIQELNEKPLVDLLLYNLTASTEYEGWCRYLELGVIIAVMTNPALDLVANFIKMNGYSTFNRPLPTMINY